MGNDKELNDSLDDLLGGPVVGPRPALPASYQPRPVEVFTEPCRKCGGSGVFRSFTSRAVGPCFACKGQGKKIFKTSAGDRAKARASTDKRRAQQAAEHGRVIEQWCQEHKAEVDWIAAAAKRNSERAGNFTFPQSMIDAIAKFGSLTENQLAAVRKLMARDSERKSEAQARVDNAPAIDVSKIEAAFAKARTTAAEDADNVAWLKLRLDTFVFSDAPARGQWSAAIFVKEGATKLGRIADGKFIRSRDCSDEQLARIMTAAADPAAAAKAYGLRWKSCSCCGRTLTNEISRKMGIGPICAERYGF